jgi:hypothetical protein
MKKAYLFFVHPTASVSIAYQLFQRAAPPDWPKGRMVPDQDPLVNHIPAYQEIHLWFFYLNGVYPVVIVPDVRI